MEKLNQETENMVKTMTDKSELEWKFITQSVNTFHEKLITPEATTRDIAYDYHLNKDTVNK